MAKGDWGEVSLWEVAGIAMVSMTVGAVKLLQAVRRGRKFRYIDVFLEPGMACISGMVIWALTETQPIPDVLQASMVSVAAWAGPRMMHRMEVHFFGGSRSEDVR